MTKTNFQFASADSNDEWVSAGGSREPADYCSRDGALALKSKIEAYWRERGQDVMIALHNVGFSTQPSARRVTTSAATWSTACHALGPARGQ